jgi:superfamily II DNA or RNA helicase
MSASRQETAGDISLAPVSPHAGPVSAGTFYGLGNTLLRAAAAGQNGEGWPQDCTVPDQGPELVIPDIKVGRQGNVYRQRSAIEDRVSAYDSASPQASHLRIHQIEPVEKFRATTLQLLRGDKPRGGMAILHPTGSGKTVTMTEIVRMLCEPEAASAKEVVKALVLVPGHQIKEQTLGNEDELGAIRTFAPGLSVEEYSGDRKSTDGTVTVMTYQALPGALARGDIDKIDPTLVVCDEAHHVIDGVWAQAVADITTDRLLLGLTATAAYSASRNVSSLFPHVLVEKSMKEGIEEGILAEMQGFMYKGKTRISVPRFGTDYAEQDLFKAFARSPDNYLAAKICAREVAFGRRGVVSCVPGFDRAHAKIMAEILSQTRVVTPEGERNIRAAFVGGEVHPNALRRIFREYREGKIDVITYVNLLLEGWDSPQSDFTVLLRPTLSKVLAEQRVGRIIRPRQGKIATVHEIMYEVTGKAPAQVTHMDIMHKKVIEQGYRYGPRTDSNRAANRKYKQGPAHLFNIDDFVLDADLAAKIAELEAIPLEEVRVACGQEAIPFDWPTVHLLATRFDKNRAEIEEMLADEQIPSRQEEYEGITRVYYPPRASKLIAEKLGIPELPPDSPTLSELVTYHRGFQHYSRVTRKTIALALQQAGIEYGIFIREDGSIAKAYPASSKDVVPVVRDTSSGHNAAPRRKRANDELRVEKVEDVKETIQWLDKILVDPDQEPSQWIRREIRTAQGCLIAAISRLKKVSFEAHQKISKEISANGIEASGQMLNVMRVKKLDLVGLIAVSQLARKMVQQIDKPKGKQVID